MRTDFNVRLVICKSFYDEVIKLNPGLLNKLMYINADSREYRRYHNVMSKKIFNQILDENISMERPLLRCSFYDIDEPASIEEILDFVERNIKYAIDLSTIAPYDTVILVGESKETSYLNNSHYLGVKRISIRANVDAIQLIESLFSQRCKD